VHFYLIFLLASVGFTAATFDAFVVGVACLRFELGFRALGTRDQDPGHACGLVATDFRSF